jgi:hypothetical protein
MEKASVAVGLGRYVGVSVLEGRKFVGVVESSSTVLFAQEVHINKIIEIAIALTKRKRLRDLIRALPKSIKRKQAENQNERED